MEQQKAQREMMERQREEEERRSKNEKQPQENQGWIFNSFFGSQNKSEQHGKGNQRQEQKQVQVQEPVSNVNHSIPSTANVNRQSTVNQMPVQNNLQKVPMTVPAKNQVQRTENEDFQMELICELLESYFKIVKKTIKDRVPKTIMNFLVNKSKEDIQNVLVQELYKEDLLESLLQESDDIAQRREQFSQNIQILTSAQRILNEIIDFKL